MVGPIWGNIINNKMGKPQSKVTIEENIVSNGDAQQNKTIPAIPEYVITLIIVSLVLYIAYKINMYIKKYVLKHKNNNITDTTPI